MQRSDVVAMDWKLTALCSSEETGKTLSLALAEVALWILTLHGKSQPREEEQPCPSGGLLLATGLTDLYCLSSSPNPYIL